MFVQPEPQVLPGFLSEFRPDAIAIRGDKKIVIEIVRESANSSSRLSRARELLSGHDDWELQVYLAGDVPASRPVDLPDDAQIEHSLAEVEQMLRAGFGRSALLQSWATLEAAVRSQSGDDLRRPQSASGLVQSVAADGVVTPDEADRLREAGLIRNRVAHGDLTVSIPDELVLGIVEITKSIMAFDQAA